MRLIDTIPIEKDLKENESYTASCDNCGKYRIVDWKVDPISTECFELHGCWYTLFICPCGEEFLIQR